MIAITGILKGLYSKQKNDSRHVLKKKIREIQKQILKALFFALVSVFLGQLTSFFVKSTVLILSHFLFFSLFKLSF
jgi:hypothetical protein